MQSPTILNAAKAGEPATPNGAEAAVPLAPFIPRHVAIIMDGNGRWAKRRHLPRTIGHRRGVEAVRRVVRYAGDRGIEVLTLFAFSRENWRRPPREVNELLSLLRRYIQSDLEELLSAGVKLTMIGARDELDPDLRAIIEDGERRSAENSKMHLILAFNYGGRDEIVRAAKRLAKAAVDGDLDPDQINEGDFARCLDTGMLPDPDLIIRTSGEQRISNFLLWQSAYAEYSFPRTLWPDFDEVMFEEALCDYARRERRFGAVDGGAARAVG